MDLSKAFDCILYDLLFAVIFEYGCDNICLLVYEKKKTGIENK